MINTHYQDFVVVKIISLLLTNYSLDSLLSLSDSISSLSSSLSDSLDELFSKSSPKRGHSQRTSAENGDFQTPPPPFVWGCPQ